MLVGLGARKTKVEVKQGLKPNGVFVGFVSLSHSPAQQSCNIKFKKKKKKTSGGDSSNSESKKQKIIREAEKKKEKESRKCMSEVVVAEHFGWEGARKSGQSPSRTIRKWMMSTNTPTVCV